MTTPATAAEAWWAEYASTRPWVGGYTCGDPDCCYNEDRYATEAEARERLSMFDPERFDIWVEYRPVVHGPS